MQCANLSCGGLHSGGVKLPGYRPLEPLGSFIPPANTLCDRSPRPATRVPGFQSCADFLAIILWHCCKKLVGFTSVSLCGALIYHVCRTLEHPAARVFIVACLHSTIRGVSYHAHACIISRSVPASTVGRLCEAQCIHLIWYSVPVLLVVKVSWGIPCISANPRTVRFTS